MMQRGGYRLEYPSKSLKSTISTEVLTTSQAKINWTMTKRGFTNDIGNSTPITAGNDAF